MDIIEFSATTLYCILIVECANERFSEYWSVSDAVMQQKLGTVGLTFLTFITYS